MPVLQFCRVGNAGKSVFAPDAAAVRFNKCFPLRLLQGFLAAGFVHRDDVLPQGEECSANDVKGCGGFVHLSLQGHVVKRRRFVLIQHDSTFPPPAASRTRCRCSLIHNRSSSFLHARRGLLPAGFRVFTGSESG